MKQIAFSLTLLCLLLAGCRKTTGGDLDSIFKDDFTPADQRKLGIAFQSQLNSSNEFDVYENVEADRYVQSILQTVINTPNIKNRTKYDWTVHILVNDNVRNAFILPGGHLYLYTGLLNFLETESQLISVMAHEIHHADTDNIVQRIKIEYGNEALGKILLDKVPENMENITHNIQNLPLSKKQVLQADSAAIALLCPFQYDVYGTEEILMKADSLNTTLKWMETRPSDLTVRRALIISEGLPCGIEGVKNEHSYQEFKSKWLP